MDINLNLNQLTTTQGFRIIGETAGDYSGVSVSSAGDVNKDGYSDIIIGADSASSLAGKSYVIFGSAPILQVKVNSETTTYGIIPIPNIIYSGFINSDTPASLIAQPVTSTLATTTSSPGNYEVTISGGLSNYYIFNYTNGLTITKTLLTITSNMETTYGTIPYLIKHYTGFVNTEGPNNLLTQPTASTTATTISSPGIYPIIIAGGVSNNYGFDYEEGFLTIIADSSTGSQDSPDSRQSVWDNFVKYGIPILSTIATVAGFSWTLWQCKKNDAFCFKKNVVAISINSALQLSQSNDEECSLTSVDQNGLTSSLLGSAIEHGNDF